MISRRFHAACFNERDEVAASTRLTARQEARGYFRELSLALSAFPRAREAREARDARDGRNRLLEGRQTMSPVRGSFQKRDRMHPTVVVTRTVRRENAATGTPLEKIDSTTEAGTKGAIEMRSS